MKIRPLGAELLRADGRKEGRTDRRTDMTMLFAFLRKPLQHSGNYTIHLLEHPMSRHLPGKCLIVSYQSQNIKYYFLTRHK